MDKKLTIVIPNEARDYRARSRAVVGTVPQRRVIVSKKDKMKYAKPKHKRNFEEE